VKHRRLTQLSFAFDVLDDTAVKLVDGSNADEPREVKLFEFSFVAVGANQTTFVESVNAQRSSRRDLELRLRTAWPE